MFTNTPIKMHIHSHRTHIHIHNTQPNTVCTRASTFFLHVKNFYWEKEADRMFLFFTHALFPLLTITQGLVWVDFIRQSVTYSMPQNSIPPVLALITALTTTAIAVFVWGVILLIPHTFHKRREQETPRFNKTTGLYAIPTTLLHAIPRKA